MRRGELQCEKPLTGLPGTESPFLREWSALLRALPVLAIDGDAMSEEEAVHIAILPLELS